MSLYLKNGRTPVAAPAFAAPEASHPPPSLASSAYALNADLSLAALGLCLRYVVASESNIEDSNVEKHEG